MPTRPSVDDDPEESDDFEPREDDDEADARLMFRGPGSALRAASPTNRRDLPCPTCGQPDRLTPADQARGYQCDDCANHEEGP